MAAPTAMFSPWSTAGLSASASTSAAAESTRGRPHKLWHDQFLTPISPILEQVTVVRANESKNDLLYNGDDARKCKKSSLAAQISMSGCASTSKVRKHITLAGSQAEACHKPETPPQSRADERNVVPRKGEKKARIIAGQLMSMLGVIFLETVAATWRIEGLRPAQAQYTRTARQAAARSRLFIGMHVAATSLQHKILVCTFAPAAGVTNTRERHVFAYYFIDPHSKMRCVRVVLPRRVFAMALQGCCENSHFRNGGILNPYTDASSKNSVAFPRYTLLSLGEEMLPKITCPLLLKITMIRLEYSLRGIVHLSLPSKPGFYCDMSQREGNRGPQSR